MSEKVLGIDLGTNSIGWALRSIDESLDNQIIDKGVLTFDKGVAEDKSGEHPMVQKRTESRGKRRNYQAEKYRKWELLKTLIENKMCPLSMDELNEWRHYKKGIGRKYPQSKKFIEWLRFDFDGDGKPDFERLGYSKHESYYLFRSLIVDESKKKIFNKEPYIIGRVLYQIVQRRGYNDGGEIDEKEKTELSKTIMKGGGEAGAEGVDKILYFIEKHKTLGSALYNIQKEQKTRIRKRYNLRSHFEAEIKEICRVQNIEHLYKLFWSAIIWQRPLRSQKGLVGICTFENNKNRCPISHPIYEEYKTWVFINNLKIKPINEDDKDLMDKHVLLNTIVYPEFYKAASDFKLTVIKNKLKKTGYEISAKFTDDTKVNSVSFLYRIDEIFGEEWKEILDWENLLSSKPKSKDCKYNIEDLWHLHFVKTTNKETGETGFEYTSRFAIEKLKLDEKKANVFSKIRLQQGYASLSINAIKKILPYLKQGYIYSEAIYLANLPKVLGVNMLSKENILHFSQEARKIINEDKHQRKLLQIVNELISDQLNSDTRFGMDANYKFDDVDKRDVENKIIQILGNVTWDNTSDEDKTKTTDFVTQKYLSFLQKRIFAKNVFEKQERLHDKIFNWISQNYSLPIENKKHLWHPSEQETYAKAPEKDGIKYLGNPEPISKGFKNPMALKTLYKLKKLINYLLETKKIDEDTRIVIEIARELNNANERKAIEKWQRDREKQNETYRKRIDEINSECDTKFNPQDKNLIDKIRLWEEQKRLCIYTGKTIGLCDVLNGAKYDYEHSIPASMSFDNELKNLTIADKTYNQQIKGKKLPSECPNYETEYFHNGITYKPILDTLQSIFGDLIKEEIKGRDGKKKTILKFKKIIELENDLQAWYDKSSDDKEIKSNIIVGRHYRKMELNYWRYKLQTFLIIEYKAVFRNSQLRDTQTMTKYSLPYLKTVFKRVEVQKGNTTADFRKIYKIQPRLEKKDRTKHSHHAIDAAILTLIPQAAIRDKILLKYNEANENKIGYNEEPKQWKNFKTNHILSIENNVLINFQAQHRTLTPTIKNVRKRGKIQFVKEKLENGKWQYKLDADGNRIHLVAKGDSIRGQLHADSFYGLNKIPKYSNINKKFIPQTDGNGNFVFEHNEKRGDNLFVTKKILITDLKSLEDLKIIIDPNLKQYMESILINKDFPKAILEPIWAFGKKVDKHGNTLQPMRHIRCKVKGGGGGFISNPAKIRQRKDFLSKKEYKNQYYAQNGETVICAFYQLQINKTLVRELETFSILDISKSEGVYNIDKAVPISIEKTIKKEKYIIPLFAALKPGQKVIFYQNDIEELKSLNIINLGKRLYNTVKFNDGRINFKHHLISMNEDDLNKEMIKQNLPKEGASKFDFVNPIPKLRLSKENLNFAVEGNHFKINIDGTITF